MVASRSGKVVFSGNNLPGYGKTVILEHSENFSTVYTGNTEIFVKSGQWVRQGESIGRIESAGSADARPEIYFEIRKSGRPENPELYLPAAKTSK